MTEKERLQALQVLDNFLSEEDENFDENDSQVWINHSNIAVFIFPALLRHFNLQDGQSYISSIFKRFLMPFLKKLKFCVKTTWKCDILLCKKKNTLLDVQRRIT